jgi:hypothetical protein
MTKDEDLYRQYKGLIETMSMNPGLYGLDSRRMELHKQLKQLYPDCNHLDIILHDLPQGFSWSDFSCSVKDFEYYKEMLFHYERRMLYD